MSLHIANDRLTVDGVPVEFVRSPNQGGRMLPSLVVCHDTSGRTTPGSSVSWFADPKAKVSAHFVVEIDGSVTQMVDCDRVAWHAGKSAWKGRSGCNSFAIGIEIVNPGKLTPAGVAWFGEAFEGAIFASTKEHGSGCWLPYTPAQIEAVKRICKALVEAYPIKEIVTHWEISPGRKVDTNPLFPLESIRKAVFAREAPSAWPLAVGSEGEDVRAAQVRLKSLGYSQVGNPDGIFGPQTRAAVLAWEAENSAATDGKVDRQEFEKLMAPDAKEMAVGAATAKARDSQKAASKNIETAAATGTIAGATLIAGDVATGPAEKPLWDIVMTLLGQAGEAAAKVSVLGVKIEPKVALTALGVIFCVALWRWARTARG